MRAGPGPPTVGANSVDTGNFMVLKVVVSSLRTNVQHHRLVWRQAIRCGQLYNVYAHQHLSRVLAHVTLWHGPRIRLVQIGIHRNHPMPESQHMQRRQRLALRRRTTYCRQPIYGGIRELDTANSVCRHYWVRRPLVPLRIIVPPLHCHEQTLLAPPCHNTASNVVGPGKICVPLLVRQLRSRRWHRHQRVKALSERNGFHQLRGPVWARGRLVKQRDGASPL
eukprot:COSAG06_NODE_7033_length_2664_cov_5.945711_2_plen_223_part_00